MAKKSLSRVEAEKAEGLPEVKSEVPENRLQNEQQISDADSALETKPADGSFTMKREKGKGSTLKQTAIANALTGSSSTAGMGINAAGRGVSGTAGGVLGAANSTSVAGQSRSASRVGKKLDRLATKLNYTPSEQVLIDVDESKPLADSADEDQGYNGTYRNEFARSQKISGAVPGDLMFQRSVDLILKDKLYFVEGQQVFQSGGSRTAINPSKNWNDESLEYEDIEIKSGNYLHDGLHFGLSEGGKVRSFFASVKDITPGDVSAEDANIASAHRLIKENVAELDRISMDAKAGDEKADLWSPLPRAIKEPTQMSYYLSSVEADTGAFVHLAYSKATTNFAYQLNRAAKDGLDVVTPAIEQCVGWRSILGDGVSLNSAYSNSLQECFTTSCYRAGDPSLMIAAYDSTGKYNNKADLLLQPRGYRMHLQTADNNMNPLRVPAEYASVFAGQECFSTIDHDYDPSMPICMTDKANIVTVHNLNETAAFIIADYELGISATSIDAKYYYREVTVIPQGFATAAGYENIYIYSKATAGDGLAYDGSTGVISMDPDSSNADRVIYIKCFGSALSAEQLGEGGEYEDYVLLATVSSSAAFDVIFHCPIEQTASSGNGNSVISSVSYFEGPRLLKHAKCGHLRYQYSDLRNNYTVTVKHPFVEGLIQYLNESIGGKVRSLIKRERFDVPLVFSTQYMTLAQLFICAATPWIIRVRMNTMRDVIYYEDNIHEYPFQKLAALKDTPFKNYVNFSYSGYDEPLQTKIMNPVCAIQWIMPEFFWKIGTEKYVAPWFCSENDFNSNGTVKDDAANMSMPSIRSGIRLGLLDTLYGMSEKDIRLSLDRFTKTFFRSSKISGVGVYKYGRTTDGQPYITLSSGQVISVSDILSAPRELGLCMDAPLGVLTLDPSDSGAYKAFTADGTSTSFRIKVWVNNNAIIHPTILASSGVNIQRAANYSQKWVELYANLATSNTDVTGLVFGLNDEGSAEFTPFANISDGSIMDSAPTITSLQRSMWTRVQMLPFVISPFDAVVSSGPTYSRDIYDIAYMFGLCGFRASDYRESVYNREKEVVNQGLMFVSDPWVLSSPIITNGASSTGQSISKGYELRSSN